MHRCCLILLKCFEAVDGTFAREVELLHESQKQLMKNGSQYVVDSTSLIKIVPATATVLEMFDKRRVD